MYFTRRCVATRVLSFSYFLSFKISLALSVPVFNEYQKVLFLKESLKDLSLSQSDIDKILPFIAYTEKPYSAYFLFRPNFQDEFDNIFIELSLSSSCDYLITANIKDFPIKS